MEAVPAYGGTPISGKVTIRDVARDAGVGVGTVSRVLTGSGPVAAATRSRVVETVERLQFRPSPAARRLATGRTMTLGAMVPFFTKHYYLEILRGVEQAASASDYSLAIYNVERPEQAREHLAFLRGTRRVDGLIVIALSGSLIQESFPDGFPFPITCVDSPCPDGCTSITVDHERGMYLAVTHLASRCHRVVALIDRPQDPVSGELSQERRDGYRKACEEANIRIREDLIVVSEYSEEGGYEAAGALLDLPDPPTALACASDLQAIGAIRAVRARGLELGFDVAITGYHDVDLAQYVGLTTVRLPALRMGMAAVFDLIAQIDGPESEKTHAAPPPELIVRESCGEARNNSRPT